MITIKDFMELVDFKITEGSEYCWQSFGPDAYTLSSWNGDHDGHSVAITFDTKTHTVYLAEVCDYQRERAYRLVHPAYKLPYAAEARKMNVPYDEAWDSVRYIDLETETDFLEKARAVIAGESYDERVEIPLTLDKDEMLTLMQAAHQRNVTFNEFVEQALKNFIEEHRHLLDDGPVIQDPPFPADNFTKEQAREAVKKAQKKLKKKNRG